MFNFKKRELRLIIRRWKAEQQYIAKTICCNSIPYKDVGVSVVLNFYNPSNYLADSVDSILKSNHSKLELILVNDGSTEDKWKGIIDKFDDSRIKLIDRKENHGIPYSINEGIAKAKYDYILKQDADDVSTPDRIEKQLPVLIERNYVGIGSWAGVINRFGFISEGVGDWWLNTVRDQTRMAEDVKALLLNGNLFVHGTMLYQKKAIEKIGGYREKYPIASDFDLHLRLSEIGLLSTYPEVLYYFRLHRKQLTKSSDYKRNINDVWDNIVSDARKRRRIY